MPPFKFRNKGLPFPEHPQNPHPRRGPMSNASYVFQRMPRFRADEDNECSCARRQPNRHNVLIGEMRA